MFKTQLEQDLKKAVEALGYQQTDPDLIGADIVCAIPASPQFGDYTTNIALQLAKQNSTDVKQSSIEIANEIKEKLLSFDSAQDYLNKIEIAGPGFINFFIKNACLIKNLYDVCDKSFLSPKRTGKKVMVEFTDPNPFKEFHIGHLFSNTIGESLSRLLESTGAEVKRANYFGDVGMHVAKSVWGMKAKLKEEGVIVENLEEKPLPERIKYLGLAYTEGAKAYEEDMQAQEEIRKINFLIYIAAGAYSKANDTDQNELEDVAKLYKKGKEWSLEYFETIYTKLGTKFDYYYPESVVAKYGAQLVEEYINKGVFERSDGAIIFPGSKFGLHTRVFINSLGLPTYEAKELGLAVKKYQDYPYDQSIIVTGNEIKEYFQVLMAALGKIKPELAERTIHIPHGMVRMTQGKMSSRKGNVLTFEWLFNEVSRKIAALMKDSKLDEQERQHVIEIVGIGAIKFSMLKSSPRMDVVFDLERSVSLQGDSGPYLQYTYARAKSVLKNALFDPKEIEVKFSLEKEEREILTKIEYFESIVKEAAENLHPSAIVSYLADFAKAFNLFYQKYPIIKSEEKREFRLALTYAVAEVLKKGLYLLGINSPERM